MSVEYPMVALEQLVELRQGFAINKKSDHYLDSKGIPLLRITDLIHNTESVFVKESIPSQFVTKKSDILFTRTGQVGLVFKGRVGVLHNNCFKVIPVSDQINREYLYWVLKSKFFKEVASSLATGAAQPDLNHAAFKSIKIPLLEVEGQKKIASILSAYDDLIENNLERIKLLEEMAEITYEEWFVRMKFPDHEDADIILETGLPRGWSRGRLDKLFELQRGFDLPVQDRLHGDVPILASTGVIGSHSTHKVDGPGVITGRSGTIGEVSFCYDNHWPLNTALWVKKFHRCGAIYAYHFLRGFNLERLGGGSAIPSLDRKVVHSQIVNIPPKYLIELFESQIKLAFGVRENLIKQAGFLKEASDILLPRLMTGMIDIEKVELPEALLERIKSDNN